MEIVDLLKRLKEIEEVLNNLRGEVFKTKEKMINIEIDAELNVQKATYNQKTNKDYRDSLKLADLYNNEEYMKLKEQHSSLISRVEELEAYRRFLERLYNLIQQGIISPEVIKGVEL